MYICMSVLNIYIEYFKYITGGAVLSNGSPLKGHKTKNKASLIIIISLAIFNNIFESQSAKALEHFITVVCQFVCL